MNNIRLMPSQCTKFKGMQTNVQSFLPLLFTILREIYGFPFLLRFRSCWESNTFQQLKLFLSQWIRFDILHRDVTGGFHSALQFQGNLASFKLRSTKCIERHVCQTSNVRSEERISKKVWSVNMLCKDDIHQSVPK